MTTVVFFAHFLWSPRIETVPDPRTATIELGLVLGGTWGLLLTGAIAGEMVYGA